MNYATLDMEGENSPLRKFELGAKSFGFEGRLVRSTVRSKQVEAQYEANK